MLTLIQLFNFYSDGIGKQIKKLDGLCEIYIDNTRECRNFTTEEGKMRRQNAPFPTFARAFSGS